MSNYSQFVDLLSKYCASYKLKTAIEEPLSKTSVDTASEHGNRCFNSKIKDLKTISMDNIAQDIIRKICFCDSCKDDESPASVDSFLIDKNGIWYFIEFKNQKIKNTKSKCVEKSYANIYWLLKILHDMKDKGVSILFDYEHPLQFIKEKCRFVLVIGDGCDDLTFNKIREAKKAKHALPDSCLFLKKLEAYIFNKASVYEKFIKQFEY